MKKKIAICGKMASGKSYVSDYLVSKGYIRIGFGDAVKDHCAKIFNMNCKDRKLIQSFAQKLKEIDESVWINYLDNKLKTELKDENYIVIDDLRFPNEYNYLRKNNFIIIKLIINDNLQIKRLKETYPENYNNHINSIQDVSEIYIDELEADYKIEVVHENENNILELIESYTN